MKFRKRSKFDNALNLAKYDMDEETSGLKYGMEEYRTP